MTVNRCSRCEAPAVFDITDDVGHLADVCASHLAQVLLDDHAVRDNGHSTDWVVGTLADDAPPTDRRPTRW